MRYPHGIIGNNYSIYIKYIYLSFHWIKRGGRSCFHQNTHPLGPWSFESRSCFPRIRNGSARHGNYLIVSALPELKGGVGFPSSSIPRPMPNLSLSAREKSTTGLISAANSVAFEVFASLFQLGGTQSDLSGLAIFFREVIGGDKICLRQGEGICMPEIYLSRKMGRRAQPPTVLDFVNFSMFLPKVHRCAGRIRFPD